MHKKRFGKFAKKEQNETQKQLAELNRKVQLNKGFDSVQKPKGK